MIESKEKSNLCVYCNWVKIFKTDVNIAMTIMARDYKGFGGFNTFKRGYCEI